MKTDSLVKRLRWVMAGVILSDTACTLLGQPASYWRKPATGHEYNTFVRPFLVQGYLSFILWSLLYVCGVFLLVSFLPRRLALIALFSFMLGHFYGASTWLCYHWFGEQGAVIYGVILAIVLVTVGFGDGRDARAFDK